MAADTPAVAGEVLALLDRTYGGHFGPNGLRCMIALTATLAEVLGEVPDQALAESMLVDLCDEVKTTARAFRRARAKQMREAAS